MICEMVQMTRKSPDETYDIWQLSSSPLKTDLCTVKFYGCLPLVQECCRGYNSTTGGIWPLHTEKYRDALISVL
ncbi:hypothetical protein Nmel_005722, partial [Mimus melanotis]